MNIRKFDKTNEYNKVLNWWKAREMEPVPQDFLSPVGFIVSNDKQSDIAAAWLYFTPGTKFCQIRFPITNRKSSKEERKEALDMLFESLHDVAKGIGCDYMHVTTNCPPLELRLEKTGYIKTDEKCNHYWGRL